jgi:hypothetical protein
MSDRLNSGEELVKGQAIVANSGNCSVNLQDDGNLVLYALRDDGNWHPRWASDTYGKAVSRCAMQGDGNLVIYGYPNALWASNTDGKGGAYCVIQDDENFVIYQGATAVWNSRTDTPTPYQPPPCAEMRAAVPVMEAQVTRLEAKLDDPNLPLDQRRELLKAIGALNMKIEAYGRLIAIKC